MGKSAVNETLPNYRGVYAGEASDPGIREQVESSDLILSIGAIKSDFNTAGFSYRISQLNTIDFHSEYINVKYSGYSGVRMKNVLRKVVDTVDMRKLPAKRTTPTVHNEIHESEKNMSGGQEITQAWFWPRVGQWLQKDDIVITETGTSNFGIWGTKFPPGVEAVSQVLWGSIGYAVGATQGAALAARDNGQTRRTILFVGDGSFQLTCQEVSTMIKLKLRVIM
jgi:pyruvate decarboxylase